MLKRCLRASRDPLARPNRAAAVRAFALVASVLVAAAGAALASGWWVARPTDAAHPARPTGAVRAYTLTAEAARWEIQPGLVVDGWSYNGQIPGPTLRATEGDLVRVHLVNRLPVATTIHWHGIDVPPSMDGVPGLSQDLVEPGGEFNYEFIATNPGTRMYHSHADTDAQMQLGLLGAFIIDPQRPEPVTYDREFTYILTEKALDLTPQVALGEATIRNRDAGNGRGGALQNDLFLMNGRAATAIEPMTIKPGGRTRLRLINLGNLVHTMHLHGHSFRIIATDGNPVPPGGQWLKDTVLIGPGERYDVAIEGTNPGVWMFHCHINNHAANGMSSSLVYDGAQPVVGGDPHLSHGVMASVPTQTDHTGHAATGSNSATSGAEPVGETLPPGSAASGDRAVAPGQAQVVTLDDRFSPSKLVVSAGTTVTWSNQGNNLHTTTSYAGLWDSGSLQHDERFSYHFTTPGTYRYLCRQHLFQGMQATIVVEPP